MEITQVLMGVFGAGAFFGGGYLWKTSTPPQKLIAPKGAENLPFTTVLVLQLNSLQDELRDCNSEKRREYLRRAISHKVKEISNEAKKSTEIDFVQGVIGVYEYNTHLISVGKKPLPYEDREIDLLRIMGKMPRDNEPEVEKTLDLQPLDTIVLKKKSNFKSFLRDLKLRFFAITRVARFILYCALFAQYVKRTLIFLKYKLSIS
jgi:hypothetical protein